MNGSEHSHPAPSSGWIVGICSVLFDIDKGQTLQHLHPVDCISDEEQSSVAFHAFPDSLSMELYTRNAIKDSSFQFRIKRKPVKLGTDGSPAYLHGYVFCRQRQDETLRRGGEQAAVVVLSALPLSGILLPLSQAAGHANFSEGPAALAQLHARVQAWPPPVPGSHVSVPAGQAILSARLPHFCILPSPQPVVDPAVKAQISRRASRTISLRRGLSNGNDLSRCSSNSSSHLAAAAEQQEITPATPDSATAAAASAAAADGCGVTALRTPVSPAAESNGHGSWNILGDQATGAADSPTASSRLQHSSRQDSNGAITAEGCPSWVTTALGQQWKQEAPFPEVDLAAVLSPLLKHLWTLWQLIITGQPLMVVGLTPRDTSVAIAALLCLIAPLPYASDYRPYFTIHDPDFIPISRGKLPSRCLYQEQQPLVTAAAAAAPAAATCADTAEPSVALQQSIKPSKDDAEAETDSSSSSDGSQIQQDSGSTTKADQQQQQQQRRQQPQQDTMEPSSVVATTQQQTAAPLDQQEPKQSDTDRQQQQHIQQQQQQQQQGPDLPALLGVTNLYFIRALPNFPNVVAVSKKEPINHSRSNSFGGSSSSNQLESLAEQSAASATAAEPPPPPPSAAAAAGGGGGSNPGSPTPPPRRGLISSTAAAAVRALKRRHQGPQHLLSDFSHHLWTADKVLVKPDYQLIASVTAALDKEQAGVAHRQLKRHFAEITAALLMPFDRYFEPGPNGKVPHWCPEAFLSQLAADPASTSPVLTARLTNSTATVSLYRAFLESANFHYWFKQHRQPVLHLVEEDVQQEVAPLMAGELVADSGVAEDPDEVSLVQTLLTAEQDLAAALAQQQQQQSEGPGDALLVPSNHPRNQQQQRQQCDEAVEHELKILALQIRLVSAFTALPRDLQVAMISSPDRRQLLDHSLSALGVKGDGSQAETSSTDDVAVRQLQQLVQELDCESSVQRD